VILAHQGGWDELLMVVVPLGLVAALLVVANHRAGQQQGARAADDADEADPAAG